MFKRITALTVTAIVAATPFVVSANTEPDQPSVYEVEELLAEKIPEICEAARTLAAEGLEDDEIVAEVSVDYLYLYADLDRGDVHRSSAYVRGVIVGCAYTQRTP